MAYEGVNFAGSAIALDSETVGKITSWTETTSVTKEMVSGSEDVLGTAPNQIIKEKARPVSQAVTGSVEGIYIPDNTGQNDLKTAAKAGTEITLNQTDQIGYGNEHTGFFENFEITGELQGVYTFSAQFHSNSETAQTPA